MNQDQDELQKFNAMAADWWNPDGDFRPLHDMNPLRLSWIESMLKLSGKKILDIGCGGGILAESLAKKGAKVTAIDLAENALAVARNHAQQSRLDIHYPAIDLAENALAVARNHAQQSRLDIHYQCISAEQLAGKSPAAFDIITCMELLEHVPDPDAMVRACSSLLKPGGYVFFATLNRNLKSLCHAIIGAEYVMHLLPAGTHDFDKFITPAELCRSARRYGLNIEAITGVTCDLTARHFRLTEDAQVNYMLACSKP